MASMQKKINPMISRFPKGRHRNGLRDPIGISILLHIVLFSLILISSRIGFSRSPGWGTVLDGGRAVKVKTVASLQGIPLPAGMRAATSTIANQTRGLHKQKKKRAKKTVTTPKAKIQKFDKAVPEPKFKRINTRIQKEPIKPPDNAVPFGQGGAPAISYAQFSNGTGQGGVNLGGDFGERFAWYVQAVRSRISANWLLATVSSRISTAPRLYINFSILRNGQIDNINITESSGIPEVDRSGIRAILASSPLAPLPRNYSGSNVSVEFWFDFQRQ